MRFSVGLCALFLAGCGGATDADIGAELPTTDETERLRAELEQTRAEMDRLRAEAEAAKAQDTPAAEPPDIAPPPTPESQPEPEAAPEPEPEQPEIEAPPKPEPEEEAAAPEPPPEIEVEIEVAPPAPPPEPVPLPPPEPPAVCGDGIVSESAGEVCEPELNPDGSFRSPWPGSCNHLCTAVYQERRIRKAVIQGPAFGRVAGADAICQSEYGKNWKALIVGEGRRATVTPLKGDFQQDWVLQSWTFYVDDSSRFNTSESVRPVVWRTDSIPLLGVRDASTEREPHRPEIDASVIHGERHLAGYRADWTTGQHCENWTVDRGAEFTTTFWRDDEQRWDDYDFGCISVPSYLRCVEQ